MPAATLPDSTARPMPVEADAKHDPLAAIAAEQMVPSHLLDGGEAIILAIKPSLWFIPIRSAWFLLGTAVLGYGAWLAAVRTIWVDPSLVVQIAAIVCAARLGVALLEWVSRLYVLTNRRLMRIRGIFNVNVFECALAKVQHTYLHLAWYERLLGLGSIALATAGTADIEVSWDHVARPAAVHEEIRRAISRARGNSGL